MTTSQYSENAVFNPGRQRVGPLVHGLICHADGIGGSCNCPAEHFDGFGFEHATLNHSSGAIATMVLVDSAPCAAMVETTYTQRLAAALDVPEDKKLWNTEAREKALALASELGVSRQAVEKFFRDESGSMSAENNSRAARFLRVDPDWLATGEGDMRSARAWPFGSALTPAEFFLLEAEDVRPAIDVLLAAVARRRSSGKHQNAA